MEGALGREANVTALFGGIGGFELGLAAAGHRTTTLCECDPEARTVLDHRFPGVPVVGDVRHTDELIATIDPRSDVLTAGFPCTDLSQAGTTKGFEGGRSSLIRDVIRLLERRPFPSLLIENVPNWRMLHGGAYLREVVEDLERLGYRWAYRTIDARAFGTPQRRLRIILHAVLEGDPRAVLFRGNETPAGGEYALDQAAHGFYWTEGTRGLGWGEDCTPTLKGGSAIGIPAAPAILLPEGAIVTPDIRDAERLQGFPAGWTDFKERSVGGGGGAFKQKRRWLLVGNAVNLHVAAWIGEGLRAAAVGSLPEGAPVRTQSWPAAAWFDGTRRRTVELSTWPVSRGATPLKRFLSHPGMLLSSRATAGFLSRLSGSRLRLRPGFKEAVACHLDRVQRLDRVLGLRKAA